jgi:MoxR-like ATPase
MTAGIDSVKADLGTATSSVRTDFGTAISSVRADLNTSVSSLRADVNTAVEQLRSEAEHRYADLVERMNDGETRLLKAFYAFAESNQKRLDNVEANDVSLQRRVAILEDRLLSVEKRLNMPPAA